MDLENAYMGRILVVDLNEGSCEEEELTEEMVSEHIGGASINLALYKQYVDRDPIVFGTGLLTGTFTPSSCAGGHSVCSLASCIWTTSAAPVIAPATAPASPPHAAPNTAVMASPRNPRTA